MAYTTINGKLVKINKTRKSDPNLKDFSEICNLAKTLGADVKVNFVQLEPSEVIEDDDTHYKAKYQDNFGSYVFEIHKTDAGFTVVSDGNICSKDNPDREYIIWNYETQIAAHMPKVLETA